VELVQCLWSALADRAQFFYLVFQTLTPPQHIMLGRGLHSSTFRLIVNTFEGHDGGFHGVSVTKTAQLELRSGLL